MCSLGFRKAALESQIISFLLCNIYDVFLYFCKHSINFTTYRRHFFKAGLNAQWIVAQSYKRTVYPVLEMMMAIAALLGLEVWRQKLRERHAWRHIRKSAWTEIDAKYNCKIFLTRFVSTDSVKNKTYETHSLY